MSVKHLLFLFVLLCCSLVSSQKLDTTQLEKSYKKYYELSRESVHLHLNKTTYLSGEEIWFTAYIQDRQSGLPSAKTTTLYCFLYDSSGKPLAQKVLYVSDGVAFGQFKVRPEYSSAELYIKAYTNWMRNFDEDDAFVQQVFLKGENTVLNKPKSIETGYELTLLTEGGNYITEATNNIGFKITNRIGKKATVIDGKVVDTNGNTIVNNIVVNSFGIGKFGIKPKNDTNYSIRLELNDGSVVRKALPKPRDKGINISVNNLFEDKISIALHTNSKTFTELKGKSFHLAVHQDGQLKRKSFKFDSTEVNIMFARKGLLPGVNIITLFDDRLNPVAERLVLNNIGVEKRVAKTKLISATSQNDSVRIQMQVLTDNFAAANLSISVMPENTIANHTNRSIVSSFVFEPYIKGTVENTNYYFSYLDRKKLFEMDLLLLTEGKSKYNWKNIFQNPPRKRFDFDKGVTIKGKVLNAQYGESNQLVIYPTSISNILITEIDNNKDYVFKNTYVIKGDSINLTLTNSNGKGLKPKMTADFLPFTINDNPMTIESLPKVRKSSMFKEIGGNTGLKLFSDDNTTYLESITVYGKRIENKLTKNPGLTVGIFEGVKISPEDLKRNRTLSRFIRSLGFKVVTNPVNGTFFVNGKLPLSNPPVIILNGVPLNEMLRDFPLESVDEVYYEHQGTHGSNGGTIYIYQKNGSFVGQKSLERFAKILATEGFSRPRKYYNPNYSSYISQEFSDYGVVHWESNTITDKKGVFELTFPNYKLKTVKLFIEGMDIEGRLISDVKIIQIRL